ncbi:gag-pol polyprotein [Tanacetum coccineum]
MMERVLADQRGHNVKVYLEEIVIRSKNKYSLIQDVEETLSEAEEAFQKIKRKLSKPQALTLPKDGKVLMLCLRPKDETISSLLIVEREGIQIPISYVSRPLQGMEVITEGPMEEILKFSKGRGRLIKWATEIRTYDISYVSRKEPEGPLVKKFLEQGEHGLGTSGASREETIPVGKELEQNLTLTPKVWRLYIGKEAVEEGSGIGMILVSPEEMIRSYAIRLNFKASKHSKDCEALLAGLVASARQGIKDLHVFIDSPTLAAQMEGSYAPAMRQERKYKEEIMDATTPFHKFRITHLLKILNPKAEVFTVLATIKLEFLNQEVSVGIKTRTSVEETSSSKKGKAISNVLGAKPNYNWETSGSN